MRLVRMKQKGDCGPACLATVLGKTLAEVLDAFPDARKVGLTPKQMIDHLRSSGVPAMESLRWPSTRIPGIVTVPSLNHPGLLHYVVWDGEQYLDPSNELLRYPEDTPGQWDGEGDGVCWSSVILLWMGL